MTVALRILGQLKAFNAGLRGYCDLAGMLHTTMCKSQLRSWGPTNRNIIALVLHSWDFRYYIFV